MSTGQQSSAANAIDHVSGLPPEVLLMICEYLTSSDRAYTDNDDLITVSQLNSQLNSVARRLLFREITITFSVKDELPPPIQQWRPQPWETPKIVGLLQGDAELRGFVHSVRLCLYPFPVQDWTKGSFDNIKERLAINTDAWGQIDPTRMSHNIRDLKKRYPRSSQGYQNFVVNAYSALYLWYCGWPETRPWTQKLEPLLQQLLARLPHLQHVETADVQDDAYLEPVERAGLVGGERWARLHITQQWSVSYADALILRAAPRSARSIGFRSWPPVPVALSNSGMQVTSHANNAQRLQDFIRSGTQFTELAIDCHTNLFTASDAVLDIWRQGLRQLRHLTSLTLSDRPSANIIGDFTWLAAQGRLDHNLDYLLHEALILRHVKSLTLKHWNLSARLSADRIQASFPALKKLHLLGIALLSHDHRQGEQLWDVFLDALEQIDDVFIVVREPMLCFQRDITQFEVVTMRKQARLALEARLGQQTGI